MTLYIADFIIFSLAFDLPFALSQFAAARRNGTTAVPPHIKIRTLLTGGGSRAQHRIKAEKGQIRARNY
jgi:hypothetical protein